MKPPWLLRNSGTGSIVVGARGRGPLAPNTANPKVLTSAVKSEIRTRAKAEWAETWRTTHRITKEPTKDVLRKFKECLGPRVQLSFRPAQVR